VELALRSKPPAAVFERGGAVVSGGWAARWFQGATTAVDSEGSLVVFMANAFDDFFGGGRGSSGCGHAFV
jgi:hypothetical protein